MTSPRAEPDLPETAFFASLAAPVRRDLAARLVTLPLRRGDVLVRQGDPADALFVVVSGRFAVTVAGKSGILTEIGPGQPIGEIAFLTGSKRTATVTAMRDSLVQRLSRAEFDEITRAHPAIWSALTASLARRLAETTAAARPAPDARPRTIALIRAGSAPLPRELVALVGKTFEANARTRLVDGAAARQLFDTGGAADETAATRTLNALERRYDYVIFVADDELTPWTEKAIRHADLVIAAARFGADAEPNALEHMAARYVAPEARRLVLAHERRGRVSGTRRWLAQRDVAMHHHVALDTSADAERLYRFVSGTARGLVACGGGAYCAAHPGVWKALKEWDIGFDAMGGTSAGSAMTAAFIMGTPPDEIDASLHDIFVAHKAMARYTWPRYSLLDHTNFDAQLERYFGGVDIEDLWLPYFAVSTNLSRYRLHCHRQGPVWQAIRASSSIPVLLPPVYTSDGEMLVDGCLLDNVPLRVMQEVKRGPNIVVSFIPPELERFDVKYETLPSRSELIRLALNPMRRGRLPSAPGLQTVLLRSLMANRRDYQPYLEAEDLVLVPPLPQTMGLLDWHRHSELFDIAHRWTLEELHQKAAKHDNAWWARPRTHARAGG